MSHVCPGFPDYPDGLNLQKMDEQQLRMLLEQVTAIYADRVQQEPEDDNSEEYDEWEESLEFLDDMIDDIQDRLDILD